MSKAFGSRPAEILQITIARLFRTSPDRRLVVRRTYYERVNDINLMVQYPRTLLGFKEQDVR